MTYFRKITALLLALAVTGLCLVGCGAGSVERDIRQEEEIIGALSEFFISRFEDESVSLDANDDWAAADLAAYGYEFGDAVKARFDERLTQLVMDENAKTSVLARCVITMAALELKGDAFESASERLALAATDEKNIYTMPYILIALRESGDKYEDACTVLKEKILACELEGGGFNGFSGGPDADTTGPVLLALSYYQDDSSVAAVCARAAQLARGLADENGVIPRAGGSSACSAGVLIPGLLSVSADADKIVSGLISLYDSESMYSINPNDRLSREQALRGLVSSLLGGRGIYDFYS